MPAGEDEIKTLPTSKGPVAVKEVGQATAGTFVALGGLGRSGCGPDWLSAQIPSHLASKGWRTILPDPYSNRETKPSLGEFAVVLSCTTLLGLWRGALKEEWLLDLVPKPSEGRQVVLAGHSWGGGAAARVAAARPEAVSRLVLVSPDVEWSVARRCWATPTLLIWAKDDMINPHLWVSRWSGHPNLTVHSTEKGGHHVLAEHAEVISKWLEQPVGGSASNAGAGGGGIPDG